MPTPNVTSRAPWPGEAWRCPIDPTNRSPFVRTRSPFPFLRDPSLPSVCSVLQSSRRRRGLTLVELIAAAAVAAIVASATVGVMSRLLRARDATAARAQAVDRAHAAAEHIASDILHVARDRDLSMTRLVVSDGGTDAGPRDELLLLTRTLRRVRPPDEGPAGGEVEVQYRVAEHVDPDAPLALWRRADQAFDPAQDAGGLAAPLIPGVVTLGIQASDGSDWFTTWDSDSYGLPVALRVVVTARADRDAGRAAVTRATARRVVAIDRVSLPEDAATDEDGGTLPEDTPRQGDTQPGTGGVQPPTNQPGGTQRGGDTGGGGGGGAP